MQEFLCVQNVYVYAQAEITDWKSKLVMHIYKLRIPLLN